MRAAFAILGLTVASLTGVSAQAPYKNASLPIESRVQDLLARMTPEEKFWQLFMIPGDRSDSTEDFSHGAFGLQIRSHGQTTSPASRINAIQHYFVDSTRLGIPLLVFEEGVHGILDDGATVFPAAIAQAASWDTALMGRVSQAIADEARGRGIRDVLSPVINIANDVRWGRVEETYGEDPWLTSAMARVFVSTMERSGVIATPKHFVANVGDGGRDSYPIDFDLRSLEEIYFPPFQAAFAAGAQSVMASYNSVNGSPASQNKWLLTDVLRGQWGFKGFVISDQSGVGGSTVLHHTEATTVTATTDALNAGLDVIFESRWGQSRNYYEAFRRGLISQAVVDTAVARVLRAKFQLGLFEHPYAAIDSLARAREQAAHRNLSREAARAALVLLKNDGALPLKARSSIALIGVDATEARLGGYSAVPGKLTSLEDALGAAARYAPGPGRFDVTYVTIPGSAFGAGLKGDYFANIALGGQPAVTRTDRNVDFRWTLNAPARGLAFDWYSARWTGTVTLDSAAHRIGVEGNDGYRLWIDGKLAIDNWAKRSYGTHWADSSLQGGTTHEIKLEYFESAGNARLKLVWSVPDHAEPAIDSAVALARVSDIAIIAAGIEEGEFRDRAKLGLPGRQVELIERVAATGKPVVVVLYGGSAITMPWLDKVSAVVDAWYPGEAGGDAVRDVLFGAVNPSGKLPITFPMEEGQLPLVYNHKPTGRGDDYVDLTGQPLFPFGYGLSYTTFQYSDLTITKDTISADGSATVRCYIRNTGTRAGDEVVQLYVHHVLSSVAQPVIALKGFQRVHVEPGTSRAVTFTVGKEQLQLLNADMKWVVEPGVVRVLVGSSSKDIRLRGDLVVR